MTRRTAVRLAALVILALAACDDSPASPEAAVDAEPAAAGIVVSPGSSIQAALDNAQPGDRVLIEPGVYQEALVVDKDGIRLSGRGQGGDVVLENPGGADNGIFALDVSDLEIENLTIRDFD